MMGRGPVAQPCHKCPRQLMGYDLIPLQRSEVNSALNVAFEADCQTDITINGQGTVDLATEATQKWARGHPAQHAHHETLASA